MIREPGTRDEFDPDCVIRQAVVDFRILCVFSRKGWVDGSGEQGDQFFHVAHAFQMEDAILD